MSRLIVVKFGGSVLETGHGFRRAAELVQEQQSQGNRLVVVVSAMKGMTDRLLTVAGEISPGAAADLTERVVGFGEEQSVRLMVYALTGVGVDAVEVTPVSPGWPILTDENFGNAEPLLDECTAHTLLALKPLTDRGKVPVICGFVGRSTEGRLTTLGRGGGDTTAAVLAGCLGADELVLVKDVDGVHSADPRLVPGARLLGRVSPWEACLMAETGAKVLHSKLFRYTHGGLRIRIVSKKKRLDGEGTLIEGNKERHIVEPHSEPVALVNMLGDFKEHSNALLEAATLIDVIGGRVLGLSGAGNSAQIVFEGKYGDTVRLVHSLVDAGKVKAITGADGLGYISIKTIGEDAVVAAQALKTVLTEAGIETRYTWTGGAAVGVLVDWSRLEDAVTAIKTLEVEHRG